jgi:N-terminal acetyltransferase B complex non-catalytic subunit
MKSYIRALQQGSDLDDVVEEKLLIGDRPKLSNDPENAMPLKERVLLRDDRERKDVSPRGVSWQTSHQLLCP